MFYSKGHPVLFKVLGPFLCKQGESVIIPGHPV